MHLIFLLLSCVNPTNTTSNISTSIAEYDVIIVGGGASGLATGKRLLELGITPLILEKESELGGAGIHAGRFLGVATELQRAQGIEDSIEFALEEWEDITGSMPNEHIESFLQETDATLSWIESFGVEFTTLQRDIGSGSIPRIHTLSTDTPHPLQLLITELQLHSLTSVSVSNISYKENIFTIETNLKEFTTYNIVLATGGFARNETIVSQHVPNIESFDWHMEAWSGMTGDAIAWLQNLSVPLQNMNHVGLYTHSVTDAYLGHPEVMIVPALERSLIVNEEGQRVFNEQKTQSLSGGQIHLEEGPLYAIFDAPMWDGTFFQGMGYNYAPPLLLNATEYNQLIPIVSAAEPQNIAAELRMDPSTFSNTLHQYNQGIEQNDDAFEKDVTNLFPIQNPPYYAVPLKLSTGKSFGGARVNAVGQTDIPNMYVVGEAAGFLGTPNAGWGFSGSITACYYLGKQVAEQIASQTTTP